MRTVVVGGTGPVAGAQAVTETILIGQLDSESRDKDVSRFFLSSHRVD